MLSLINFNNMNITDILFRGTFSTFDDYHKYLDIVKNKFNYATIWMNYETRIEHPDTTIKSLKRNNCHISAKASGDSGALFFNHSIWTWHIAPDSKNIL